MKKQELYKPYQIVLIVLFSMVANVTGALITDKLQLPVWLDSYGTFLTAYTLGPVCGAIVGICGNIMHGFFNKIAFLYSFTSVLIAFLVGIMAQKHWLDTVLKTMSLSFFVTLFCVFLSMLINITFYNGHVGNVWGDSIMELFFSLGLPRLVCMFLGQFYVDFLDKVIMLLALYFTIQAYRAAKPILPKFLIASKTYIPVAALLFVVIGTALNPQKAQAQVKRYNSFSHTIYNKENGLSGGKANDIIATDDGILWIGTYEGLYRHNGTDFFRMNDFDSIKTVRCLYVDDAGRLFVGTNDNGLSVIIDERVVDILEEKDGLPADAVRSIIRGSDGYYYVGTAEDLAVLSLGGAGLSVENVFSEIQTATKLSADEKSHIAAVTSGGSLYVLYNQKIIWMSGGGEERYTTAAFLDDGNLYAVTENGRIQVYSFAKNASGKTEVIQVDELKCDFLRHINSVSKHDDVIFLCADNGVGYIQNGKTFLLDTGTFNNSIDNMTEDYQGNLWFTSSRLGLLKLCETSFFELYIEPGVTSSVVNSTGFFNGLLYLGTDDGLMAINLQNNLIEQNDLTELLVGVRVRSLLTAKDGSFWICTKSCGLIHVNVDGSVVSIGEKHQFRVAIELSDGTVAVGANDGVGFVKNDKIVQWLSVEDGFETPVVLSLSETRGGLVLAGTDGGGLAVIQRNSYKKDVEDSKARIRRIVKRSDGLSSNVILRTVNDFDGENFTGAVFAVTSNGLCYLNFLEYGASSDNEYAAEADEQFLPSIKVLSNFPFPNNYDLVVHEDNNIFVMGGAGIFVVNRTELLSGNKIDYELLNVQKGLRGSLTANSWNCIDEEGNIYLSCDTGASRLNLNSYNKAEHSYRMLLRSVFVNDKRLSVQKDVAFNLPLDAKTIEIYPEVINYSVNDPYISVFMEGFDEKPSVIQQSEFSKLVYTNLKPGTYKLHIAVLDDKGRDKIEESVYTFSKSFRLYDNWWFSFYAVAVAMLAISWFTWFVTSTIQQRNIRMQENEMAAIKNQLRMGNETIFSIANAVEVRDKLTGRHSYRVAEYAVLIARELGFSEDEQTQIRRTGLLHDIGKIGVPDSILNKTTALTEFEYDVMKTHTIIGGRILKDFTIIPHVDEGAKFHHEHYDGSGYPNGLKGEEIPLNARIIGIADAFDAMTASRVYRKGLDMSYVKEELKSGSGKQFDPGLVEIMLELIESGKLNVEKMIEESNRSEEDETEYSDNMTGECRDE